MNGKPLAQRVAPRLWRDYYQLTKPKVVALLLLDRKSTRLNSSH